MALLFSHKVNISASIIVKTNVVPMVGGCNLSNEGPNYLVDTSIYRPVVGALQYTTITRPEIGH